MLKTAEEIASEIIGSQQTSLSIHMRELVKHAILADRKARDERVIEVLDKLSTDFQVKATWYVPGSHVAGDHPHNHDIHRMLNGFSSRIEALLAELRKEKE